MGAQLSNLSPPQQTLAAFADAERFGNKTANLAKLANILAADGRTKLAHAAVPAFHGLSHEQVLAHLKHYAGAEFNARCAKVTQHLNPKSEVLTSEAKAAMTALRDLINKTFTEHLMPVPAAFLEEIKSGKLMVRSTGREDSDALANAGGNESVINVAPKAVDISAAIGRVVASYFSERSYVQRIIAKDDVVAAPFMPVLLQRMVGEKQAKGPTKHAGLAPTSGVMFTREPEGPTPNVMQIQATFGHNEAVVAGLLPCDTFYVGTGAHQSIVRYKPERLAPSCKGGLERVPNPSAARLAPALGEEAVQRLHSIGEAIHDAYGKPMDIEWTYDRDADVFHIFQARPLILPAQQQPTHLDPQQVGKLPSLRGSAIGAGGGDVRLLRGAKNVIVAPDLGQALKVYLESANKQDILAVMVSSGAEPTSHEATTFRAQRVPVLQVKDHSEAAQFVAANPPLLFDPGVGLLVAAQSLLPGYSAAKTSKALMQSLTSSHVVRPGWGKHPLPQQRTLTERRIDAARSADFLQSLLAASKVAVPADLSAAPNGAKEREDQLSGLLRLFMQSTAQVGGTQAFNKNALLEKIEAATPDQRDKALAQLLTGAAAATTLLCKHPSLQERAKQLLWDTLSCAERVQAQGRVDAHGVAFLFEMNWLRSMFAQHPDDSIVHADCYASLLGESRELDKATQSAKAAGKTAGFVPNLDIERFAKLALKPDVAAAFKKMAYAAQGKDLQRLQSLMMQLQGLNVSALWLNNVFPKMGAAGSKLGFLGVGAPQQASLLAKLRQDLANPANSQAIAWANDLRNELATWRTHMGDWATPEAFPGLLAKFTPFATKLKDALPQTFAAADHTGKLAILAIVGEAVDVFDQTVKSVTGSPAYKSDMQKAQNFRSLLVPYTALLKPWLEKVAPASFSTRKDGYVTVAEHASSVSSTFQALKASPSSLQGSAGFNVCAAQLGSGADHWQHLPKTLEDHFTKVHQSLLAIVNSAYTEHSGGLESMPPDVQRLCGSFLQHKPPAGLAAKVSLLGIEHTHPRVAVKLALGLREHSMTFTAHYDVNHPEKMQVEAQYFSRYDENFRMRRAKLAAGIVAAASGVGFTPGGEPTWNPDKRMATWTWDVDTTDKDAFARFTSLWPRGAESIARTSYACYGTGTHQVKELEDMLKDMGKYIDVDAVLDAAPREFFAAFPEYNGMLIKRTPGKMPGAGLLAAYLEDRPGQTDIYATYPGCGSNHYDRAGSAHDNKKKRQEIMDKQVFAHLKPLLKSGQAKGLPKVLVSALELRAAGKSLPAANLKAVADATHSQGRLNPGGQPAKPASGQGGTPASSKLKPSSAQPVASAPGASRSASASLEFAAVTATKLHGLNVRQPSRWFGAHPQNTVAAAAKTGARIAELLCKPIDFLLFGAGHASDRLPLVLRFFVSQGVLGTALYAAGAVATFAATFVTNSLAELIGLFFMGHPTMRKRIAEAGTTVGVLAGVVPTLVAANLGTCITGSVKLAGAGVGAAAGLSTALARKICG